MDKTQLNTLLNKVASGEVSPEDAALVLKMKPIQEVGEYAKVDLHRGIRQGVPEVIYGAGKTKEHVLGIAKTMLQNGQKTVLVTRVTRETADFVREGLPSEVALDYNELAKTCVIGEWPAPTGAGKVVVATSPWPRKRRLRLKYWATKSSGSLMWGYPVFTGCCHIWMKS